MIGHERFVNWQIYCNSRIIEHCARRQGFPDTMGAFITMAQVRFDLFPDIRAIANWNFSPLNGRRRKTYDAEAFHRRTDHQRKRPA